jgi:hypothetical protein
LPAFLLSLEKKIARKTITQEALIEVFEDEESDTDNSNKPNDKENK